MSFGVKPRVYGTAKEVAGQLAADNDGVKNAAPRIGISLTQFYARTDPQEPEEIRLHEAWILTSPRSCAAAEFLAAKAGAYLIPIAPSHEALGVFLGRGGRAEGELMASIAEGMGQHAAGTLSGKRREAMLRCLDQLMSAFGAARSILAAADYDGEGTADA